MTCDSNDTHGSIEQTTRVLSKQTDKKTKNILNIKEKQT